MLKVNRLQLQVAGNLLVSKLASAITILAGSLVLMGWWLDIEILKSGWLGITAAIKPNAGLCFVLSGASLWWLALTKVQVSPRNLEPEPIKQHQKINYSQLSGACAIAVIVIATLTLSQYILGGNLGIDELLVGNSSTSVTTLYPLRMGWNTSLTFLLVGLALGLLLHHQNKHNYWYAQLLTLIAAVIASGLTQLAQAIAKI